MATMGVCRYCGRYDCPCEELARAIPPIGEHRWETRPARTGHRTESNGERSWQVAYRAPAWRCCTRCGVSNTMAEHMGWPTCKAEGVEL